MCSDMSMARSVLVGFIAEESQYRPVNDDNKNKFCFTQLFKRSHGL